MDPVTLEIHWNRLITILDETDLTLVRAAFSTIVGEGRDFACILLDADAVSLAQSTLSSTGFTVMLPRTTRKLLETFPPETLEDGDVLITNDPWLGTGHLPDVTLVRPIFFDGELVAYIAIAAHLADMGGTLAYFEGRDVYEEGLFIPPSKLYKAGEPNEDLLSIIRANVRVPDLVIGDLRAIMSAGHVGELRLKEFFQDYGLVNLNDVSAGIQRISEEVARDAVREIPDGTYVGETEIDGHGRALYIRTTVTVKDDTLKVDFTGTSDQVSHAAINCTLNATLGDVLVALKCSLVPDIPNNEAIFRPVTIEAPEGCILNCRFPAPVTGRSVVSVHTHEALYAALSSVVPDLVQSASGTFWGVTALGRDENNEPYSAQMIVNGGKGAVSDMDGLATTCFPVNSVVTPTEIFENIAPVVIEEKALWTDSAGAGRTRGGLGQRLVFRALKPGVTLDLRPVNLEFPPPGVLGGQPGCLGHVQINGEHTELKMIPMEVGDVVDLGLAGAGGFGPADERPREKVLEDVRLGYISKEAAVDVYGLDPDAIDALEAEQR